MCQFCVFSWSLRHRSDAKSKLHLWAATIQRVKVRVRVREEGGVGAGGWAEDYQHANGNFINCHCTNVRWPIGQGPGQRLKTPSSAQARLVANVWIGRLFPPNPPNTTTTIIPAFVLTQFLKYIGTKKAPVRSQTASRPLRFTGVRGFSQSLP